MEKPIKHITILQKVVLVLLLIFSPALLAKPIMFRHERRSDSWLLQAMRTHFYFQAEVGAAFSKSGKKQTVHFSPVNYSAYRPRRKYHGAFDYGFGFGFYSPVAKYFTLQWGVAYSQTENQQVNGAVYQYGLFRNLNYHYGINNYRLLLATRWLFPVTLSWSTYIDLDLGYGWLTASGYSESPLNQETVENPSFMSKTKAGYAYQLGFGVGYRSRQLPNWRWTLGLGYLGLTKKGRLGLKPTQITADHLSVGNANAERIWLGVTYYSGKVHR